MKTWKTSDQTCSSCGYAVNAASNLTNDKKKPTAGDVSVCLRCGHLMAFNNDMTLRELTSDEMYKIAGDKRILAIQEARHIIMKQRTKP